MDLSEEKLEKIYNNFLETTIEFEIAKKELWKNFEEIYPNANWRLNYWTRELIINI